MRKITLLLTIFISAFFVNANPLADETVLMNETFDYSVTNLKDASTWSESIKTAGTLAATDGFFIISPTLEYSNNGDEYINSNVGKTINSVYHSNVDGADDYRLYRDFTEVNSGIIYLSFLYKAGVKQGQSQSEVIGLANGASIGARIWVGKPTDVTNGGVTEPGIPGANANTELRFGVTTGSGTGGDIKRASVAHSINDVYLLVLKHDFSTNTTSLYVNPSLGGNEADESPVAQDNNISVNQTSLNRLGFRLNKKSHAKFNISGIRVATTWADAVAKKITGLPQLATPIVGTASNVRTESFTANWTAIAGATGYNVKVYEGENILGTFSALGENIESLEINGLWANTTYSYTVVAKGDGTTTGDSEESTASAPFVTLAGLVSIETNFSDNVVWGEAQGDISLDNYPSSTINDFVLKSAYVREGSIACLRGGTHVNRIAVDKSTHSSSITLPIIQSVKQIEIHATSGSDEKGFKLEKTIDGKNWETVGTYTTNKAINIFTISVSSDNPIKFRIANNATSALYIWKIITRTTNPTQLETPAAAEATAETKEGFTANWATVANATGYVIRVYLGTALTKTIPVTGQTETNFAITGLDSDTEYTYKVQAIGDNDINYLDSYLSDSKVATTLPNDGTSVDLTEMSEMLYAINNTIYSSQVGVLEIYSLSGAKLLQASISSSYECNLSSGIYIVCLKAENGGQYFQKVRIQ